MNNLHRTPLRLDRRQALRCAAGLVILDASSYAFPEEAPSDKPRFQVHAWKREPRNPILPPSPKASDARGANFDVGCCMNPFVLRRGDDYWLFYAGADAQGHRRICLATAPANDL